MSFATSAPLLPEILALHGKWRAPDPAVVTDTASWTWREFTERIHAFGNGLLALGVQPGDRVGLLMANGSPMVEAMFGAIAMGGVVVPLNVSVSDDAAVAMFNDAGVTAVIASDEWLSRLDNIAGSLEQMPIRIAPTPSLDGWRSMADVSADQSTKRPEVTIEPDDLINIIYSSGTTGLPKGIAHDHRGRRDWAYDLAIALRYHGGARTLLTIGLYSNISWVAMLSTLLAGGCIYVESRFSEDAFLDRVEADRITHTAMVPIQFQRVIEAAARRDRVDVSSMQAMMSCGSPLREALKRDIFECFDCGVIELYGLTEGIITTLETEHAEGRWASVGRPLIGTDICIVGDDDQILGASESGEICSRGRIAMPGYWNRHDANEAATFTDPDGKVWLRSGDIGYIDSEGFLYIVDRKKDMILSGGQNVYPQDIEAVVTNHDAVFDVAVIGLPSERWGETPVALVVFREGEDASPEAIKDWVNKRVGKQQRLTDVIVVDELPRNPNGKILKRELRK
ncbi:MAG: class I adenylate-forming enzyme family protein, partial [Halieaceae bacterium]|nr:class I adenylate-forming enzyme family protein [Halieaceae bacterium]